MRNIRLLRADEIEARVQECRDTAKGSYVSILLYKTARTDMQLLDETFGPMNWQTEYKEIDGKMYCCISVYDKEKKEWIKKWNVGTENKMEAEKSEASDAFKRAGFLWGIGTELYSAPTIRVWDNECNIKSAEGKKPACYDKFAVKEISYNEQEEISELVLYNVNTGRDCFIWKRGSAPVVRNTTPTNTPPAASTNRDARKVQNNGAPPEAQGQKPSQAITCAVCDAVISQKVFSYSLGKYGRPLCMDCQKKNTPMVA